MTTNQNEQNRSNDDKSTQTQTSASEASSAQQANPPNDANEPSDSQQSDPKPARKILIGSQRDAADPELGSRRALQNASVSPSQVGGAIQPANAPAEPDAEPDAEPGAKPDPNPDAKPKPSSDAKLTPEPSPVAEAATSVSTSDVTATVPTESPATPAPTEADTASYVSASALAQAAPVDPADAELEAALDDLQMDSLMGESMSEENQPAELDEDEAIRAIVTRIHNDNVFFSLKGRFEGIASKRQFKEEPEEGAMMDVKIVGFKEEEGLYEVAIPGASISVADWSDLVEGAVVEASVTGSNTGGLEVNLNNIRGFIPASQIDIVRVENFGDFVNQKLQCVVVEVNERRKKLVLSRRAILEREKNEMKAELLKTLAEGQTMDGLVTKLMDFGAFVDIGGVEGLVHVSKMSWERVSHPKEILEPGQKISVKVEKINPETGKISLSYRDTLENPWTDIDTKYPEGAVVGGTVTRLAQFGAFVRLEPGVEGLVHISELAHHRVMAVKNIVSQGDSVQVKVMSVDPQAQKIGLSLKATQTKPEKASDKKPEQTEEPLRESAVKKRDEPLKGGRDRGSGGEQFGLNW